MGEELAKLIEAGFIREIKHPDWLANLVMVPKKDKSWRLCVDLKDLNKACPKDPFPPPPHRPNHRCYRRARFIVLPRRLLRIPSDQNEGIRLGRNGIYHPVWAFLL